MDKLENLQEILRGYGKVAIAYSGGCDSNFLFHVACLTLGKENVLAVVCIGAMMSKEDIDNARNLLKGFPHIEVQVDVFGIEAFKHNLKDRCYHCKKTIMTSVIQQANELGFQYIVDGKNLDDEGEYRPGSNATKELGILSPLATVKMNKQEIRQYSKELGVVTHDKPANACLASRFPYDTVLTQEKLELVDKAEALLHQKGIYYVRVRVHDTLARIEVEPECFNLIIKDVNVIDEIKKLGFTYVTLDLKGITSGSYDK